MTEQHVSEQYDEAPDEIVEPRSTRPLLATSKPPARSREALEEASREVDVDEAAEEIEVEDVAG
jgi:hypothetical protein